MSRAPADEAVAAWPAVLAETVARLDDARVASPAAEARLLVEEAAAGAPMALLVARDEAATRGQLARLEAMVTRRLGSEPLQYVLGHWAFRTLDLLVDPRVLIPRPETEVVAGHALSELDRLRSRQLCAGRDPPVKAGEGGGRSRRASAGQSVVVDLGTGSGALGFAIAVERPGVSVWAVDRSPDALEVARANLNRIGAAAANVRLLQGSWFDPLPPALRGRVDVIVSNPPYVAQRDPLPPEVGEHEPREALIAGPSGLEAIETIVGGAGPLLAEGGSLVVEIGAGQAAAAAALAEAAGFADVAVHPDLAGRDRVLVARLASEPASEPTSQLASEPAS